MGRTLPSREWNKALMLAMAWMSPENTTLMREARSHKLCTDSTEVTLEEGDTCSAPSLAHSYGGGDSR